MSVPNNDGDNALPIPSTKNDKVEDVLGQSDDLPELIQPVTHQQETSIAQPTADSKKRKRESDEDTKPSQEGEEVDNREGTSSGANPSTSTTKKVKVGIWSYQHNCLFGNTLTVALLWLQLTEDEAAIDASTAGNSQVQKAEIPAERTYAFLFLCGVTLVLTCFNRQHSRPGESPRAAERTA